MLNEQTGSSYNPSPETMPNWLHKRASLTPDRIAVRTQEQSLTFYELNQRALQTARGLQGQGVRLGDKVALLLRNSLDFVVWMHALTYVGAGMVMLNTRLTAYELAWQLQDSGAKLLLFDAAHIEKAADLLENPLWQGRQIQALAVEEGKAWQEKFLSETESCAAGLNLQLEIQMANVHTLLYTSGTTGHPKGVQLSYSNHWWSAIGSALNLGLHAEDEWLCCVPLFHVSGLSILMKNVIYGMPVFLLESFDPNQVNQAILSGKVTLISVVGTMLSRMLDALGEASYPAALRCLLLGGGPAPLPILEACVKRKIPVYQTYGMTETGSQIVTLSPEYMISKLGSAGKPLFPAQLRIEAEGTSARVGEIGEIVVKGPNVTRGYWKREEATRTAIREGWLYTGDLGYLDQDGFLYVVDRRSDLIISGGENVYPAEVEEVLLGHHAIAEAGVTGSVSEVWGQVPVAFVKIRDGLEFQEEEILTFCRERLAKYKVPAKLYQVTHLPRNASNKLLRRKLLELLPEE